MLMKEIEDYTKRCKKKTQKTQKKQTVFLDWKNQYC